MKARLRLLWGFVGWRRYADLREQLVDEDVMLDGIREEDRIVDHRVVEGAAVRLILQQGLSVDAEHLQPDAAA